MDAHETASENNESAGSAEPDVGIFLAPPDRASLAAFPIRALGVLWLFVASFGPLLIVAELGATPTLTSMATILASLAVPLLIGTEVACRSQKQTRADCTSAAWTLIQSFAFA